MVQKEGCTSVGGSSGRRRHEEERHFKASRTQETAESQPSAGRREDRKERDRAKER